LAEIHISLVCNRAEDEMAHPEYDECDIKLVVSDLLSFEEGGQLFHNKF
jgi:hypothetical protein